MDAEALAEQAAPYLGTLVHPGDGADVPPFPLSLGGMFGPYQLPEGFTDEDREELGIPTPEFPRMFLEAVLFMFQSKFGVVPIEAAELADLRAAAAANEGKRNAMKLFHFACGAPAFRVMVKDFDSDNPIVPCAVDDVMAGHNH